MKAFNFKIKVKDFKSVCYCLQQAKDNCLFLKSKSVWILARLHFISASMSRLEMVQSCPLRSVFKRWLPIWIVVIPICTPNIHFGFSSTRILGTNCSMFHVIDRILVTRFSALRSSCYRLGLLFEQIAEINFVWYIAVCARKLIVFSR